MCTNCHKVTIYYEIAETAKYEHRRARNREQTARANVKVVLESSGRGTEPDRKMFKMEALSAIAGGSAGTGGTMQEMNWTQLWLDYRKKQDCGNGAYFAGVALAGFSTKDRIVAHALEELKRGAEGMLGAAVSVTEETGSASMLLKKCGGEPALDALRGGEDERAENSVKAEGFFLQEKEGVLTVAAVDARGLLYGVFALLRECMTTGITWTAASREGIRENLSSLSRTGYWWISGQGTMQDWHPASESTAWLSIM